MSLVGFEGSVDNIRILDHELPLEQFAEMSRSIIKTYTGVYHGLCWNRTTRTPARLTKHILGTGGRAGVQSDDSDKWTVTSDVRLEVYDILGRRVATLANGRYLAGKYAFTFNANGCASGVYFYKLTAGTYSATKKMMLVK